MLGSTVSSSGGRTIAARYHQRRALEGAGGVGGMWLIGVGCGLTIALLLAHIGWWGLSALLSFSLGIWWRGRSYRRSEKELDFAP